jgi:hypothetical protein
MRKTYSKPVVKSVKIDNQISMVMMSELPPTAPGESLGLNQVSNVNPYKILKG